MNKTLKLSYRLHEIVKTHKLSHRDLVELTGASYSAVSHWLVNPKKNDHRAPSEQTIRLLDLILIVGGSE